MPLPLPMQLLHHYHYSCLHIIVVVVVVVVVVVGIIAPLCHYSHCIVIVVIVMVASSLQRFQPSLLSDYSWRRQREEAKAACAELDSWFKSFIFGNGH